MIRVCVVSALYHPDLGGLGRQAQLLSERLRRDGVDLFVISRKMDLPGRSTFSPGVEVIRVPAPFPDRRILEEISLKNVVISLAFSAGCLARLIARRRRYDLVHFHGASIPLLISLPFLKLMGKKVVAKVAAANLGTEAGSLSGRYGPVGNLLARMMRSVDAFIAISDEIREGLLRDGVPPDRIHRISNFVDPEIFRPPAHGEKERLKEKLGYAGKTLVLYAGRLVERKGVSYLLEAWKAASPDFPRAGLLILGDGPLRRDLEDRAARLGIAHTVRFAGQVDNVPEALRAADLFVLPSLQEGMANSLLEAMASGVPVVATRIGGVMDVVEEGVTGLVVEPGDPRSLAGSLRAMLGDPPLRARLAGSALETIVRAFGPESRSRKYRELYRSLHDGEKA